MAQPTSSTALLRVSARHLGSRVDYRSASGLSSSPTGAGGPGTGRLRTDDGAAAARVYYTTTRHSEREVNGLFACSSSASGDEYFASPSPTIAKRKRTGPSTRLATVETAMMTESMEAVNTVTDAITKLANAEPCKLCQERENSGHRTVVYDAVMNLLGGGLGVVAFVEYYLSHGDASHRK